MELKKILNHPWYQKWECGELPHSALKTYAEAYYWQVAKFPRYLSLLHSQTESLENRQIILRNLNDEENPKQPHPELWLDFAETLGADRQALKNKPESERNVAAIQLTETFTHLCKESFESALGAILAYESQVPEVATFKAKALRAHYFGNLKSEQSAKGTLFFDIHAKTDVWHTEELETLYAGLSPAQQKQADLASLLAREALWTFLDAMPN